MIKWFRGFRIGARSSLEIEFLMLSIIVVITALLALQWKNIHFPFTEANLLPDDNIVM
jgi:hypothetical protein